MTARSVAGSETAGRSQSAPTVRNFASLDFHERNSNTMPRYLWKTIRSAGVHSEVHCQGFQTALVVDLCLNFTGNFFSARSRPADYREQTRINASGL